MTIFGTTLNLSKLNKNKIKNKTIQIKYTYGISCGKTSVTIFIESVLALEVGAAARRIFKRAIMYWKENYKIIVITEIIGIRKIIEIMKMVGIMNIIKSVHFKITVAQSSFCSKL